MKKSTDNSNPYATQDELIEMHIKAKDEAIEKVWYFFFIIWFGRVFSFLLSFDHFNVAFRILIS